MRPHNLWLSSSNKIVSKEISHNGTSITEYTDPEKHRKIIKIKRKKGSNRVGKKLDYPSSEGKRRRKVVIKKRLRNKTTPPPLLLFTRNELEFNEVSTENSVIPRTGETEKSLINTLFEEHKFEGDKQRDGRKLDFELTDVEDNKKEEEGPTRLQISLEPNEDFYDEGLYDSIERTSGEITSSEEYNDDENSDEDTSTEELPTKSSTYELQFPELSESLDNPSLSLKTTVIWSTEYETKTTLESKNKTYTFVVTRVNGDEHIVTSSTEVLPHTKTITLTEPVIKYTTLTILDLDVQETIPSTPISVTPESNTQGE